MRIPYLRLTSAAAILFSQALSSAQCPSNPADGPAKCKKISEDTWQWTITQPPVIQRVTEFTQVRFEPGQTVFVNAVGCVNTGSGGWKRYVDPMGGSTDRYYHGLIWIPEARVMHNGGLALTPVGTSLVRMSSISPDSSVNSPQSEKLIIGEAKEGTSGCDSVSNWLRLGYEINPADSGDYSYTGTPAGQGCETSGKAVVTILITSRRIDGEPSRQLLPFDPVSIQRDPNGLMESPNWYGNSGKLWPVGSGLPQDTKLEALGECLNFQYIHPLWRVQNGVRFLCTQQASLDVPISKFNTCLLEPGFGELHGHVNWAPVTYIGKARFNGDFFSPDGDIDLQLFDFTDQERAVRFTGSGPDGRIGPILTQDSQGEEDYKNALWLEFGGYEVTDHFSGDDWTMFQPAKPKSEEEDKRRGMRTRMLLDQTAIATGLLGLDCVHDCHTELHPVYALAFRANENRPDSPPLDDDKWMIFVRNSGNEGDCGSDLHFLDRNQFTIFLPAPLTATGGKDFAGLPTVNNQDPFLSNVKGLKWKLSRAPGGVLLQFTFDSSDSACTQALPSTRIHGELCLNWTTQPYSLGSKCELQKPASGTPDQQSAAQCQDPPFKPGMDKLPVANVSDDQVIVTNPAAPGSYDFRKDLNDSRKEQARAHPGLTQSLQEFLLYLRPSNVGAYYEGLSNRQNGSYSQVIGGRIALIQTFLGSVEFEGGPGLPQSVTASNGRSLTVMTSDWLGGLRVQLMRPLGLSLDLKGGQIFRSASSGYQYTTGFKQYSGHDGLVYGGFGVQPFRTRGNFTPLRVTLGTEYVPGTGEWIVRFTAGPQFHLKIWPGSP